MLQVTILLLNGNYASTALGPVEIFHSAGRLWNLLQGSAPEPLCNVTTASVDGASVKSPYGVELSPQFAIDEIVHTDLIIVPSLGLELEAQLVRHARLLPWLQHWYHQGAYLAGICTGTAYLAEAGLLDGRKATTHWAVAEDYARRYPHVKWHPELFITEDERLCCGGGVYASIDLSLYLVQKFCGHEIALQCAKSLLLNMPRTHQTGYAVLPLSRPHSDEAIHKAEQYIEQHIAQNLSIERLAVLVNMSTRTFIRRFKAATGRLPGNYLQAMRIEYAKRMLEEGIRSIQSVSSAVGYDDLAFFRKLFRRFTDMTPAEYRASFQHFNMPGKAVN